jgi:hydrogenase maturation protease
MEKTLILGLGNPILSDDGVGIKIANRIKRELSNKKFVSSKEQNGNVDVMEASIGGLGVLDVIVGYRKLIVIDAIKTKGGNPGTLYKLEVDDLRTTIHISSPHDVNFATAINIGRKCGLDIPQQIDIYAVEIKDNSTFGEKCTPEVERAIPGVVKEIMEQSLNYTSVLS